MLHIIQVVVSGFAEIPKLFIDETKAESAYIEGAKTYWPQLYSVYCDQNGVSQDSISSAKSFSKSFNISDKTKINHWVVKPEDVGLDKLNLLLLGEESIQKRRKQIQSLAEDTELKTISIQKEVSEMFKIVADLIENVNSFDMLPTGDQSVCNPESEVRFDSSVVPQEEPAIIDVKYSTPEWQQFVGSVKNLCGGSWSEFSLFTRHDWRQDVYGNLTSFEYWEWAATKIDDCVGKAINAGYTVEDADQQGKYMYTTPDGVGSENSYTSELEAWCHASFHLDGTLTPQE